METKHALEQQIKQERSAVLVVNTHSRRGQRLFFKALDALEQRGIHVTASYPVRHPDRLPEVIQEAIARGNKLVIVGGGDGTISAIVDYFAYQDVVLGLLPLGTSNSFARTMNIPLSLEGALEVITQGKVVDVDLGKAGSDYFANTVTIGLTAEIARTISRPFKRFFGPLAYGAVGLKLLASHQAFSCQLQLEHTIHRVRTHQLVVANGSFVGVTQLTPDASADERQLLVFTLDTVSRWRLLLMWAAFLFGKHSVFSEARFFRTAGVTIETTPLQYIDVDGETTTQTPITIALAPEALKVMAPRSFEEPFG
jgi:diacylglycerol kinase (ATP)